MVKTLILYQSKYGFTKMIAKSLSLILGPAKYCRTSEFKGNNNDFEAVVICTPIYNEVVDNNILEYVSKNADWLKQKKVILIYLLGSEYGRTILEPFEEHSRRQCQNPDRNRRGTFY